MKIQPLIFLGATLGILTGCGGDGASGATPEEPIDSFFQAMPEEKSYPQNNQYSIEKEQLGEFLFWDPILSGGMNIACASCHHPNHAWADARPLSVGADGVGLGPNRIGFEETEFHSPTIINVGFTGTQESVLDEHFISGPFFWDLRAATLEHQAVEPIKSQVEMRGFAHSEAEIMSVIVQRLEDNSEYLAYFEAVFGEDSPITEDNIAKSLATFQRRIVSSRTRFDDYVLGDEAALTQREITGLNKFINGGCARCHSGSLLSDFTIHSDQPVIRDKPAVRTPSLRNVALTAPYMHDGSRDSLRRAISLYEERGDLEVTLDDDDFGDIEAFLNTLTDNEFYREIPTQVPSGLPVGGDIHL